mgnify:CR=1 FL=1
MTAPLDRSPEISTDREPLTPILTGTRRILPLSPTSCTGAASWIGGVATTAPVAGSSDSKVVGAVPGLFVGTDAEAVAIVDIGHERTSVAIGRPRGAVEFARTFPGGG